MHLHTYLLLQMLLLGICWWSPVSSEIYAVAKFMTSAKFMTLTLTLTLIYDPNPNPNSIPCEILDACADSPIVINFASHKFRATPDLKSLTISHANHTHFLQKLKQIANALFDICKISLLNISSCSGESHIRRWHNQWIGVIVKSK